MKRTLTLLAAALLSAMTAGAGMSQAQDRPIRPPLEIRPIPQLRQPLPNPILYLTGTEVYSTPGGTFQRFRYDVLNKDAYPAAMFAPAPGLPPCGANANSSRSWVDFFENGTNRRIYGFCALGSPSDLGQIWFALPEGQVPPSYIYIEINDRQTNTKYRSNLADTVM
ncbi:MAG TPA: hypothetical protein VES64_04290 [Allosphingosinicella sp.]|nr:hypothetical protein [Allosphingosinicella sp.]